MISTFTAGTRRTAAFWRSAFPKGVISQGNRTSNKSFTTITGVLRIDDVVLEDDRSYLIMANNLRLAISGTLAATDHYNFTIRYDGTGAAATTSSTEIGRLEITPVPQTVANDSLGTIFGWVNPNGDADGSFLLCATRTNGAATCQVQADTGGVWLTVLDMGFAVADTGVDI